YEEIQHKIIMKKLINIRCIIYIMNDLKILGH
ncbi:hypothetical protein VIBC2010_15764, partial [Vibrio caribbeanicus ATCC BAA-2122]